MGPGTEIFSPLVLSSLAELKFGWLRPNPCREWLRLEVNLLLLELWAVSVS